jgi:hypothetical protein
VVVFVFGITQRIGMNSNIELSKAGLVSLDLCSDGGFRCGMGGGNIIDSGTQGHCTHYEEDFEGVLKRLK